jgi:hypothetical protein
MKINEAVTMKKIEIAKNVFNALASDNVWEAGKYLADNFTFAGPVPEPIGKVEWIEFHAALKKAFPDWQFSPTDLKESGNTLTGAVHITGTHTGTLSIPGLPTVQPTGKKIKLPAEYFTISFEGEAMISFVTEGTSGAGILGIYSQLGVQLPKMELAHAH